MAWRLPAWLGGKSDCCQRGQFTGLWLVAVGDGVPLTGISSAGNINEGQYTVPQPALSFCAGQLYPQKSRASRKTDPAQPGDFDRRGHDHAFHERIFP